MATILVKVFALYLFVQVCIGHLVSPSLPKAFRTKNLTREEKLFLRRAARSKLIRSYMNATVDPCDNFLEYSCGNWNTINRPSTIFDENDVFHYISRRMERNMVGVIQEETTDSDVGENEALTKVKSYYRSCLSYDFSKREPSPEKVQLLDSIFGKYVLTPAWNASEFDWISVIAKMQIYGANAIIYESVSQENERPLIYIKKGAVALPGIDIADLLLASRVNLRNLNSSNVVKRYGQLERKLLSGVVQFALNLSNFEWSQKDEKRQPGQVLTLEELTAKVPLIDWTNYFTILLGSSMNTSMNIFVEDIDYFHRAATLIKHSEPETVATYLALHFLQYLQENVLISKYSTQRYCSMRVLEDLPLATYVLHIKQFNLTDTKPEVLQMAKDLQNYYMDTIQISDWISNRMKSQLISKLNRTKLEIGYPDSMSLNNPLDKIYKDLTINPDNFDRSFLHCLEFKIRSIHNKLSPLIDNDIDLNLSLIDIKPRYDLKANQITIPAGILVPPIYHHQLPVAFKFGSLGSLIASAFTDILHSVYRQFAEEDDSENLQNLHKCFHGNEGGADGTNGLLLGGQPDNQVMDETIADLVGLRVAFAVFEKWMSSKNPDDEAMPGLSMTNNQLFFLSFGQTHCGYNPLELYFAGGIQEDQDEIPSNSLSFLRYSNRFLDTHNCSNKTRNICL